MMESAKASNAWSSLCSSVLALAKCARLFAAFASRSALSFPYTPTCAGTCLNSIEKSFWRRADSTRFMTFHRSAFSKRLPLRVHPSASHSGRYLLMPSIQILLSEKTTRRERSFGQVIALRTAMTIAASSARLFVCLPGQMALML